jgi:hypothetical protein
MDRPDSDHFSVRLPSSARTLSSVDELLPSCSPRQAALQNEGGSVVERQFGAYGNTLGDRDPGDLLERDDIYRKRS